jgi:hypothetical protein
VVAEDVAVRPEGSSRYPRTVERAARFVRGANVAAIKKRLRSYTKLRNLVDRWVSLATELFDANLDQSKQLKPAPQRNENTALSLEAAWTQQSSNAPPSWFRET